MATQDQVVEMSKDQLHKLPLVPNQQNVQKSHSKLWIFIFLFILLIAYTAATVFITRAVIENNNSASSQPNDPTPKNLIIIVSDGMGQSYNTAYRAYKNLTFTLIDQHFKGRYSTTPTNKDSITDSAAGATVFSTGQHTHNSFIGIDAFGNPHGSILAAAKRQGKGTGIVVTKSVTDATPASFTSYSMDRDWEEMISKQQATRHINGKPMLDILLGGGREHFVKWDFFGNESKWRDEYGWNAVTDDAEIFIRDIDEIDIDLMPFMGLFADDTFPFYLDRINDEEMRTQYPSLLNMSRKAINLLDAKYKNEGFFLLVEASKVDTCGHNNDIVCLLWEMEEMMETTEYIMDWAQEDGDTLVVVLADHETGGLAIARDGSYYKSELIDYLDGKAPRNLDVSAAWGAFEYDYSIDPPQNLANNGVEHYGAYKFFPAAIEQSKHTAKYIFEQMEAGVITTVYELYAALETMYCDCELTMVEKEFIASVFNRSNDERTDTKEKAMIMLMNARTLAGWTTHGHTGADVAVYAYGPRANAFVGHRTNYQIGQVLTEVFGVEKEQQMETEYVQQMFVNGSLKICDASVKIEYVEWNISVPYPEGNLLYNLSFCVEEWI